MTTGAQDEPRKKIEMTENIMERLLDFEITEHGAVTEEIELICCVTGFRRRFLVHYLGEGLYRSAELEAS